MKVHAPWLLLVTLVLASGFVDFRIRQFPNHAYEIYIPEVVDGSAEAPGRYRVLVPFMNAGIGHVTGGSPAAIWHVTRLAWFLLAYVVLYAYLKTWVDPAAALGGVAAVAATLPLTYTNSWAHADSIPELALYSLGCLAIVRASAVGFGLVLVVAALNRETAAFLLVAYALVNGQSLSGRVRTAGFTFLCGVVLVCLRLWRGVEHYDYWQLPRNIAFLGLLPTEYDLYKRTYAWFIVALAAPALVVIASRWASVPRVARRLLFSAVPFTLTAVTLSSLIESRIFLPLYPLVMPALMCALLQPTRSVEESTLGI